MKWNILSNPPKERVGQSTIVDMGEIIQRLALEGIHEICIHPTPPF